ncbi:MAG: M3 family oligoendopeptidase [Thaumarchaeota archaeon]|nr:M3 family oligoendopeptidase [Nitrososphaerota archaeon]
MARTPRTAAARAGAWSLSELPGPREAAAEERRLRRAVAALGRSRRLLRPSITAAQVARIVSRIEAIHDSLGRIHAHAALSHAADTRSEEASARLAAAERLAAQVSNGMLFFEQWWKVGLDARNARRILGGLGRLEGHFAHMRLMARHTLPEAQERIINIMEVTGTSALVRLYDRLTSAYEYRVGRRSMGREELSALVRSPRATVRRAAYRALLSRFAANRGTLADIYSSVASEWESVEVGLRSHASPISVRNMANNVDDRTVSALLRACEGGAPVFRRFFAAKARMLGLGKMRRYDLYAPVPGGRARNSYAEATGRVLGAMSSFSPEMASMARRVIESCHVDSEVRKGKRDGAFCSTVTPGLDPYVLMSFTGTVEDTFTLAHELGHAVHSVAASSQSILAQGAPLPLAETASTFSEALLHDSLMEGAPPARRRAMLSSRLDSLYATIMRQSFFTLFEQRAHKMVASGATAGEISAEYARGLRAQFGTSVEVSADFADEWVAIPHFYHAPFYCYAYSFGCLMALALSARRAEEGPAFAPTYMGILAAGGSEKPEDLMGRHGFDIGRASFWRGGMDYVARQARELERLR